MTVRNTNTAVAPEFSELLDALKSAAEWSFTGLVAGLEDFLILSEYHQKSFDEPDLVQERSPVKLASLNSLAIGIEVMMYTQQVLELTFSNGQWATAREMISALHKSILNSRIASGRTNGQANY